MQSPVTEPPQLVVNHPNPATSAPAPYEAFDPKDAKWFCLDLRLANGDIASPTYHFLLSVDSDGAGTQIILLFSFSLVKIYGKNLQKVGNALRARKTGFLQEYSQAIFAPPDADAPVISRIEIAVKEVGGKGVQ